MVGISCKIRAFCASLVSAQGRVGGKIPLVRRVAVLVGGGAQIRGLTNFGSVAIFLAPATNGPVSVPRNVPLAVRKS